MNEERIKLIGNASKFIAIPSSIILNNKIDTKRVISYIFFAMKCGKDNELNFTIDLLVSWCGFVPNYHKGKINDKFFELIDDLEEMNFISCDKPNDEKDKHSYNYTAYFNEDAMYDEINNPSKRFALLWIDEIKKIMNYRIDKQSKSLNSSTILLVFAYLRMMIYRRDSNKSDRDYPEAYNNFYYVIADDIGISVKTLSIILNILSDDLQLIYMRRLPTIKHDNKFRTDHTIFCNTYKRQGSYLISSGEEYYMNEANNKMNKVKNFIKGGNENE